MALYTSSTSKVRVAGELSRDFPIDVGVHQGSALSPLLFIVVMEEASKLCRKGDPLELLYADDLILTAETREEVWEMFNKWKDAMELRGLRINLSKTKLLVTGKSGRPIESGNYPCGVCGRGVGRNSIECTTCGKWCHFPCSGLPSLNVPNFSCPTCVAGPRVVDDDSITIADGTIMEVE